MSEVMVIARSVSDEAIQLSFYCAMDCFASLAMTVTTMLGYTPSQHPRFFLLRLLDQFLADHHRSPRHDEDHRRSAKDRYRENRLRQRQRAGGMAAEIGAELRDQRADALLQKSHRARCGAGGVGANADG